MVPARGRGVVVVTVRGYSDSPVAGSVCREEAQLENAWHIDIVIVGGGFKDEAPGGFKDDA